MTAWPRERLAQLIDARLSGAACAGRAPLFDLDTSTEDTAAAARHALAVRYCHTCPVRATCRALAEQHCPATFGVWAGRVYGAPRYLSTSENDQ